MCYAVCAPLQAYLEMIGCETKLIEGEVGGDQHFWLQRKDGTIIDPAADQFSEPHRPMPKVFIGHKPEWYRTV